jgi:hypothetical protein
MTARKRPDRIRLLTAGWWVRRPARTAQRASGDRGDVPGWVMIAVMTAALVVAILIPFRNTIIPAMTSAIQDMFGQAR